MIIKEEFLVLISTPVYAIVIGLEILLSHVQKQPIYTWRSTLQNFFLSFSSAVIDILCRGFYLLVLHRIFSLRLIELNGSVLYWILLIVFTDFLLYWLHRIDHYCRFFWAVHVTHHSSEHMNITVGFRSSVFQPVYRYLYFIPLAFIGFRPLDILLVYSALQIWGVLLHTEFIKKMGWLEFILVTPSHHRVHHASNLKYLDKNMGMFLIIWDKIFGTFQPELQAEKYEPIKYGLTTPLEKDSPANIIFHEWKNIRKDLHRKDIGWKEKTKYVFGPPGWSHDGSRLTSEQLRKKMIRECASSKYRK